MKHPVIHLFLALVCYLGIYKGHLAIFQNGTPKTILPYPAHIYSRQDQEKLEKGIPFSSQQELSSLLEDFLS